MVNILASHIVLPNEATPECRLWLSNNDHVVYLGYVSTIYAYKARHSNDVIERMKNSLGKILVHYYPVAGRLRLTENGRMELECNAKGALLLEAESSKTLDDYGDFLPSDECVKELVPTRDPTQPVDQLPLLMVQLTRFNRDEGFIIGVAWSHLLSDGLAATRFINAWAKITRGGTLDPNEIPFLDRTILNEFPPLPSAPCFDHPELKPPPLILGRSDSIEEQKKKTSVALLKLTQEQVSKLRKEANYIGESSRSPYSRFEAIVAHIWRCASKARELDDNQPTQVRFYADIRNRLNPPLPQNYFGNALAETVTPFCQVGEIIANPLSFSAHKIREATEVLTNEYIRSQINVMVDHEKLDNIREFFKGQGEGKVINAPFPGNPNLLFTSWIRMPVYEENFGWGKPVYFGSVDEVPHDMLLIIPGPDGDGSIHVRINFQTAHIKLFNKLFYEDL